MNTSPRLSEVRDRCNTLLHVRDGLVDVYDRESLEFNLGVPRIDQALGSDLVR